jgi:hypothetical protein
MKVSPLRLAGSCPILAAMPRKRQSPPQSLRWIIYKLAARQTWIGEVDAADEREAVDKAAAEFKQYAPKLMAVRR